MIKETYLIGQGLFERSNKYFEKSFIEFFKSLTDLQVEEIKAHFEKIRIEREESRKEEAKRGQRRMLGGRCHWWKSWWKAPRV